MVLSQSLGGFHMSVERLWTQFEDPWIVASGSYFYGKFVQRHVLKTLPQRR